ncbi:ABC transporter substrate-binding protein [Saccharibacillus endophyticus]|uniref:ABC transporter substrate-binding protein n=1 Tax=Saccharibacillus endophyticus TaxID=2060666 RepID=A0ABQ1ZVK4_9BACL|nr:ABC transporter substrate-binding protein [Saccharibacillus endophyticus]GGH78773.1 ABC transporter substrate-binding protein [Saccharibacillus endophyticus]
MLKKKWLPLVLTLSLAALAGCSQNSSSTGTDGGDSASNSDAKTYKIAISQIVEHPSLDATREGFVAALKDAGIVEGENLTLDYNNAQGDSTNNLSIAQKLAGANNDLVFAIATPSAQAVAAQVKETPVVFAAVTDPVSAKIVASMEQPGANVTGASDTNPEAIKQLADFIAEELPNVKTVGLVLNEGEPNAVVMADRAEEELGAHGITLVKAAVTNTSEVQQAAQSLVGKVDALYITLDNTVVSAVDTIIKIANDNKLPFFSSDRDTVEKGAFATVGFKYYDHGYQAGEMAVQILKDGKKPADLPVAMQEKLDLILNLKAAEAQGIEVTDEMKGKVQDQENNIIQ